MKPAVDEMFPEGAGPYVDLDEVRRPGAAAGRPVLGGARVGPAAAAGCERWLGPRPGPGRRCRLTGAWEPAWGGALARGPGLWRWCRVGRCLPASWPRGDAADTGVL